MIFHDTKETIIDLGYVRSAWKDSTCGMGGFSDSIVIEFADNPLMITLVYADKKMRDKDHAVLSVILGRRNGKHE